MVKNFRKKIDLAQSRGLFAGTMLEEFPTQCCGIASRLLAEFLLGNGIETLWISAEEFGTQETHAWLVVKDYRIDPPRSCFDDMPNSMWRHRISPVGKENRRFTSRMTLSASSLWMCC